MDNGYVENPMVLPEFKNEYNEEEERRKYNYLLDIALEDAKDSSLGL